MAHFYPEGSLTEEKENQHYLRSIRGLEEACAAEAILEARAVVCDAEHNLWVDFGFCRGIISIATAPAAAPSPAVIAHPLAFIRLPPSENSIPRTKKFKSGRFLSFQKKKAVIY